VAEARIVVVGTGALATALCASLACALRAPALVTIVSGDEARARSLCTRATLLAAVEGARVRFRPVTSDAGAPGRLLDETRPDVLVNCVSLHMPRLEAGARSAWTDLVRRAGFGLTLPLQATPAISLRRALSERASEALFVNACYPDLVNPLLSSLGLETFCGIGNANLVATALQQGLSLPDQRELRVLAHHRHLHGPSAPEDGVRAWFRGQQVVDTDGLLAPLHGIDRTHRDPVSGRGAARLIAHIIEDRELVTSLPGPLGLPGGYPVRVLGRRIELALPPRLDRAQAIAWNQRQCRLGGAVVEGGRVEFAAPAAEALEGLLPGLVRGFDVDRTADACHQLLELRRRLREEDGTE
jgi:hypothetical protein